MLDKLIAYVEQKLRPDKKLIGYNRSVRKFYIFKGDTSIVEDVLNISEFFTRYHWIIKDSPHYHEFMALILGSHAED